MFKRPSRLSKGIKKSKLKRKSISESRFPKSIKKSSRRRVYEDMDDMVADIFAKTDNYEDFLDNVEFDPRNPDANRVAIYRAIELQYDAETADYYINALDKLRKTFDVYSNEDAFDYAVEGNFMCIPEIEDYADFAKLYLATRFGTKYDFMDAVDRGLDTIEGLYGHFLIDAEKFMDINYDALGKALYNKMRYNTEYKLEKFILSPSTGLFFYPDNLFKHSGLETYGYLKNAIKFD